jgi:hypothetical protein
MSLCLPPSLLPPSFLSSPPLSLLSLYSPLPDLRFLRMSENVVKERIRMQWSYFAHVRTWGRIR